VPAARRHTVTVEIDATERAGDYISGTRDASPYRDGTTAHTRTISLASVMDRIREQIRQVRRQD
jgi:hypothetical protein